MTQYATPAAKAVDAMNKDELEAYARKAFGFELDKRRKIDDLVEQVKGLEKMKAQPKTEEKPKGPRKPKLCRNIKTGNEFQWNPIYEGNPDLEIIEWE